MESKKCEKKIKIYTMTHKHFELPPDPMYIPLQVGSAVHEDLGYLRDDGGAEDTISRWNCYYSELTGLYWVWKNEWEADIIGTCHYRRFLIDEREIVLTGEKIEEWLSDGTDVITTRKVHLNNSYREGFSANHNLQALDTAGEVIRDLYPEDFPIYEKLVNGPDTYFGNMLITSRKLYGEYCAWLFSILQEVQRRINLDTDEDSYHKRVLGFISEFLLLVWVTARGLRVRECKVGIFGEKAEITEVKMQLALLLAQRRVVEARRYFAKKLAERPDLLMEASDITGQLRMAMQLIATLEQEMENHPEKCLLDYSTDFYELVTLIGRLDDVVARKKQGSLSREEQEFLRSDFLSHEALQIAEMIKLR